MKTINGLTPYGMEVFKYLRETSKRESWEYIRGYLDSVYRNVEDMDSMDRDLILAWILWRKKVNGGE